ncbi:PulJ/GspJ family protein [Cryobacterium tepidiphilum]|uniref:Prepilin-type N-terminal cleavage/methylation domain-containing protein n=1 Tax=Cryobacterium tepidiphilum TaxID=2486026 RepID=A0A3M8L0Z0_9MICO|nr:prepilin-type N-terminal cleavage/methylation domain-containing protein [Cryobacterium tepidiphilum]RNE59217.1 hypothetical protein EEJ31_10640 [Cryobacterium tepidiphilum]
MSANSRNDEGLTLIELLVAMMVSLVVLLIVGSLLVNTLKTERTVRTATQDTSSAQLVAKSVSQGVRNATDFWHSPAGSVPEILMARTQRTIDAGGNPVWVCRAWSFADGQVRTATSSTPIAKTQTAASVQSWTLLADGVEATTAGSVALPVFAWSGRKVDLALNVSTGTPEPTLIHTTAVSRQEPAAAGAPCF